MKIFIPENLIIFNFVESFYNNHFCDNIILYNVNEILDIEFTYNKIKWTDLFKNEFLHNEAYNFYNTYMFLDMFSWCYKINHYKFFNNNILMFNMTYFLYELKNFSFIDNQIMAYVDLKLGYSIFKKLDIFYYLIPTILYFFRYFFWAIVFFEGNTSICQLKVYTFIFFEDTFKVNIYYYFFNYFYLYFIISFDYLYNLIYYSFFVNKFLFFLLILNILYYYRFNKYYDYYVKNLEDYFFFVIRYYINYTNKYYIVSLDTFFFFINLKKLFFDNVFYFFLFLIFHYAVNIYFSILNFFLFIMYWIINKLKVTVFWVFITKYVYPYGIIFKRQYFFLLYAIIALIGLIRNTNLVKSFIGYVKWMHVYEQWDEFVEVEWLKFKENIRFESIDRHRKKRIKWAKERQRYSQGLDNLYYKKLEKEIEQERLESYKKTKRVIEEIEKLKEFKREINIEIKKEKAKIDRVDKAAFFEDKSSYYKDVWKKYIDMYITKPFDYLKEKKKGYDTDENLRYFTGYKFNLTEELGKDLYYYKWLLKNKYVMLKWEFTFLDYYDFMWHQREIFLYYTETILYFKQLFRAFTFLGKFYNGFFFPLSEANKYIVAAKPIGYGYYFTWKNGLFDYISIYKILLFFKKYFVFFLYNIHFLNFSFVYMFFYFWYLIFIFYKFINFFFSSQRLLLKYKIWYYINRIDNSFMLWLVYRKVFRPLILLIIKSIKTFIIGLIDNIFIIFKNLIKKIIYFINLFFEFVKNKYKKRYYFIKRILFDIWFFLLNNTFNSIIFIRSFFFWLIIIYIIMIIIFPEDFIFKFIKIVILDRFFEFLFFYYKFDTIQIFSFIYNFEYKEFFFFIFTDFFLMDLFYDLIYRIFYIVNIILSWLVGYYDSFSYYILDIINFDYKYRDLKYERKWLFYYNKVLLNEIFWMKKHWFLSYFFRKQHYYYVLFKSPHKEMSVFIDAWMYEYFYTKNILKYYILNIFYFSFKLILYFPIWIVRYGLDYLIYYNYDNIYIYYLKAIIMYLRWNIFSYFSWSLILNINFFDIMIDYIIYFTYFNAKVCVLKYVDIISFYWLYFNDIFFITAINYFFLRLSTIYFLVVGQFKFILHFFQCVIPFIRFFYRYSLMSFLFFVDMTRSIISIVYIIYLLFIYIFKSIIYFFSQYYNWFVYHTIYYELLSFIYEMIMYPIVKIREYEFFYYYGDYGLFDSGRKSTYFSAALTRYTRKNFMYYRHDYLDRYYRWAVWHITDIKNLNNYFIGKRNYSVVGYQHNIIHLYVFTFNILFLNFLCLVCFAFNRSFSGRYQYSYDAGYNWYRVSPYNKILALTNKELNWLTHNMWIQEFKKIKFLEFNDDLQELYEKNDMEEIFKVTKKDFDTYDARNNNNKYVRDLYLLYKYSYKNYHTYHFDFNTIRFLNIRNYINFIFDYSYKNNQFIKSLFNKNLNLNLDKDFDFNEFLFIRRNNSFYHFWNYFGINYIVYLKSNYKLFKAYEKKKDMKRFINYVKAFYFFCILDKDKKRFFDLHDFYFDESNFYTELFENWKYYNHEESNILRNTVNSRESNKYVYSYIKDINPKYIDNDYLQIAYDTLSYFIKLNDFDVKYFGGFFNVELSQLFGFDRIVPTRIQFDRLEYTVLDEWEDFLEAGWQKQHLDSDVLSIHYNLSLRLRASLLTDDETQKIKEDENINYRNLIIDGQNLIGKLVFKSDKDIQVNYWIGITFFLPIIGFFYFYKTFFFVMPGNHKLIWYIYEIYYIFPFYFYQISPYWFYCLIGAKYWTWKKMFSRKRKAKHINPLKFFEAANWMQTEHVLLQLCVNFTSYDAMMPTLPSLDFFFFYLFFLTILIFIYKFVEGFYNK